MDARIKEFTSHKRGFRLLALSAVLLVAGLGYVLTPKRIPYLQSTLRSEEATDVGLFTPAARPVSYDVTTPPSTGCEDIVAGLQHELIKTYSKLFKGLRYVNIWGYLETSNKGDAAIWTAQQILLSMLGIQSMEACRFANGDHYDELCDLELYRKRLEEHAPHSGIVMAGGGNFNDYYWQDQPQRIELVRRFPDFPIRMFPQSVYMRKPDKIAYTKDNFVKHNDLQLGARDRPSFDWLNQTFGPSGENGGVSTGVMTTLTPDIAFMFGNRPDFRTETPTEYDILIMHRVDAEISTLDPEVMPRGNSGTMKVGPYTLSFKKADWNGLPTPGLNDKEQGKDQRAYLKASEGFRILGRAEFVITDRLHGHILSTIIGVPHVLLDSKLGKNLALHDTWTINCDCTRIATSWEESVEYARMWFEKAYKEGRWKPTAVEPA